MIRTVTNFFWVAFLADGIFSVFAELLALSGEFPMIDVVRSVLAIGVVLLSLPVALMVVITPRAPKRILVPLILFTWWTGLALLFPLGFSKIPHLTLWASIGQLALAVGVMGLWRLPGSFWFGVAAERPVFTWKNFLLSLPVAGGTFAVVLMTGTFAALSGHLATSSGGYVQLRPDGIYLLERRFQSGDREVRLAGMMHIAEEEFYTNLLPEADPKKPSVVLVEGVTDRSNLMGDTQLSYAGLARMLRISSQENSAFMNRVVEGLREPDGDHFPVDSSRSPSGDGMDFVHADVDINTFDPKTIAFVVAVMSLFQSEDLPTFFKKLSNSSGPLNDESAQKQVMADILEARNEHLFGEIQSSLANYHRIIVPWGALHLMGVESWLLDHDFVQSDETERRAVGFW